MVAGTPPSGSEPSEEDEDAEAELARQAAVAQKRQGHRGSVLGESHVSRAGWRPPVHAKTPAQKRQIEAALSRSFLFSSLSAEDLATVVAAFAGPHHFERGKHVITEGAVVAPDEPGLYIVGSGTFDVFKRPQGKDGRGNKVFTYDTPGQSFGELALMYNCPRAATVVAADDGVLWSIDRDTFNNCVKGAQIAMRDRHSRFLASVEVLRGLAPPQLDKVVDVIKVRFCKARERIVRQGDEGSEFFILEEGRASALIDGKKVKDYTPGGCFGELALIKRQPRKADVVADTEVRLLVLDGDSFRRLLGPLSGSMLSEYKKKASFGLRDVEADEVQGDGVVDERKEEKEDDEEAEEFDLSLEDSELMFGSQHTKKQTTMSGKDADWEPPAHPKTTRQREQIGHAVQESFMFSSLTEEKLEKVIDSFRGPLEYQKRSTVIKEGDTVSANEPGLFVLERGALDVYKATEGGPKPGGHIFRYDKPGQSFGELALIYDCPRGATVIAAEYSVLWSIDRVTFNHLIKGSHIIMRSKIEEFLSSVDIMRDLSLQDRERVADLVQLMEYRRGERVIRHGQPGDAMYMVKAGNLFASIDGLKVKEYGPGDYFGELALLRSEPRKADVFVDHSGPAQLMSLDGDSFRRLLGPAMETLQKRAEAYVAPVQSSRKVLKKPPPGWRPPVVPKSQEDEYQLTRAAQDSPLLSRLPQRSFDQVVRAFRGPLNFKKGQMIIRQGSVLKHERILMLSRGIIDVCKAPEGKSPPGQKLRQYDHAGQTFCEQELLYGEPSIISAVTSTSDVVMWELDKDTFMYLVAEVWMERQKHLEDVLADIKLLQVLAFEDQKKLLQVLGERTFHKGQYIIKSGDVGKEFYIVEEGSASARVDGRKVETYGMGSYFGELALVRPNSIRNADVVASTTPTRLLVLDSGDFRKILGNNAPVLEFLEEQAKESYHPRTTLRPPRNSMLQAFPEAAAAAADVAFEPDQPHTRPSTQSLRSSLISDDHNKDGSDLVMEELAFALRRGSKIAKKLDVADEGVLSSDNSDEAEDDINSLEIGNKLAIVRARGRRWCVSGEKWSDAEEWLHHHTSKGLAQSQRIMNACMKLFMFSLMPSEDLKVLVGAFKGPLRACAGDLVIRQGQYTPADEPALYVVESGSLKGFHSRAGVPLPGEHVKTFVPGHAFGELALLHDSPRPITVVAKSDCLLWWIDRRGADHIVKESCSILRARREAFLENVKILASLTAHERSMIAESMYSRVYEQGDMIIRKGDQGDEFFMIEEGSAEASIRGTWVKTYAANDYFGELSLIRQQHRAADVSATFTPTRVAILHASSFRSLLGSLDTIMAERAKVYINMDKRRSDFLSGISNEGIRGRRRSELFGNKASVGSLKSLFSVEPGTSERGVESPVNQLSKWWGLKDREHDAPKPLLTATEDKSWTCSNPRCRFINLGHVDRCMNCDHFHVSASAHAAGAGVGLYGGSGSSPSQRSGSSGGSPRQRRFFSGGTGAELAALPASPLAVAAAEAAQAAAVRPISSAGLDVVKASSSFVTRLGPADCLADDGAHIDFAGAHIMRFGMTSSRTTAGEAGIAQWPFPVAPGERFFARVLAKGTFGEVGIGLAPLRRGPCAAALPSSGGASSFGAGGGAAISAVGRVTMVGWAPDEVGFHGNHGKCYTRGKSVQASLAWEVDDIVECGLTLRGQAYFARNGERVIEADGFWPTSQAYPTMTLRSMGSEMLVSLKEVSDKSLLGLGSGSGGGGFEARNAWDLLTAFRRTVVDDKRTGAAGKPGLSMLDRWFGSCGYVAPACGSCTQIEAASK